MNVYFINPCYISPEKLNIISEVLCVNQIINLVKSQKYQISSLNPQFEIHNLCDKDQNDLLKEAVYKFIAPISKLIIEDGKWKGDIEVLDLYQKSYSGNPIHNLVKCKEKNFLILFEHDDEFWTSFSEYAITILNKYGAKYNYSDRICFCKIDKSLNNTWIYLEKKKKCLICKKQESLYDPLLSYINIKTRERYKLELGSNSIFDYLLTPEGLAEYKNNSFVKKIKNFNNKILRIALNEANRNKYEENDAFDRGEEELRYIMENGGDWIRD